MTQQIVTLNKPTVAKSKASLLLVLCNSLNLLNLNADGSLSPMLK
jgi:hypothetical protein